MSSREWICWLEKKFLLSLSYFYYHCPYQWVSVWNELNLEEKSEFFSIGPEELEFDKLLSFSNMKKANKC